MKTAITVTVAIALAVAMFHLGMRFENSLQAERDREHWQAEVDQFGQFGRVVSLGDATCVVANVAGEERRAWKGSIEPTVGQEFVLIATDQGITLGIPWPSELESEEYRMEVQDD